MLLLQRRSDKQMFIPANSIATTLSVANEDRVKAKPLHLLDEYSVRGADGELEFDNEVNNGDGEAVGDADNGEQTKSGASLTATSDDDKFNSSNSDMVRALKEVCNMFAPNFTDIQLPNEGNVIDVKVLGERTREHLNALYRSSILNSARNKALNIGTSGLL